MLLMAGDHAGTMGGGWQQLFAPRHQSLYLLGLTKAKRGRLEVGEFNKSLEREKEKEGEYQLGVPHCTTELPLIIITPHDTSCLVLPSSARDLRHLHHGFISSTLCTHGARQPISLSYTSVLVRIDIPKVTIVGDCSSVAVFEPTCALRIGRLLPVCGSLGCGGVRTCTLNDTHCHELWHHSYHGHSFP